MNNQTPIDPALRPQRPQFHPSNSSTPSQASRQAERCNQAVRTNSLTLPRPPISTNNTPQSSSFAQPQLLARQTQQEAHYSDTPTPRLAQARTQSYTPPEPLSTSPCLSLFQSKIKTPADIQWIGLDRVFQYIKELEAQNQGFREQAEAWKTGLDRLAEFGEAAQIENDEFWGEMAEVDMERELEREEKRRG